MLHGFSKFNWLCYVKTTTVKEVIAKLGKQKHTFGNFEQIIYVQLGHLLQIK